MEKKIVIITGANSGIGKAAATKFATNGHTVIMACRNMEISSKAQKEIIEQTQNTNVILMNLDVSSFQSIQEFSSEFKSKFDRLDILIHNAAYFNHGEKQYQVSKDDIELTFATNTFGPFLMTQLLKDLLEKSEDPRILHACTTNIRHFFNPKRKIDFDDLRGVYKGTKPYSSYKMYGDSKMALLMLTFKMANAYEYDRIKVNAIQISATRISKEKIKNFNSLWRVAATLQTPFTSLPETVGETYYYICTSDEFKNTTGKLIDDKRKILQPSKYDDGITGSVKQFLDKNVYPKYADKQNLIEKVWELSSELTKGAIK